MILHCNCNHAGQDALHGKGNRVHNAMHKSDTRQKYRCTVCRTEREATQKDDKK